jgi:putative redox protein
MTEIKTRWLSKMSFESEVDGHTITMDASPEAGGENDGPRPKPLLLASLAGCTGMDVVSLLNKMRVEYTDLQINVKGELSEEHPRIYRKIHISYLLKGREIDEAKVEKAVLLSQEKYCGVSAMLRQAADVSYDIRILKEEETIPV